MSNTNTVKVSETMSERLFMNPDTIVTIKDEETKNVVLSESEKIHWLKTKASDLYVFPAEYVPIIHRTNPVIKNIHLKKDGYSIQLPDYRLDTDDKVRSSRMIGMAAYVPDNGTYDQMPFWSEESYYAFLEAAGMLCPTMRRLNDPEEEENDGWSRKVKKASIRRNFPPQELAEILSAALGLYDGEVQIPVLYGNVLTCCSPRYVRMKPTDIDKAVSRYLKDTYPDAAVSGGSASADFLVVEYALNDAFHEDSFKNLLQEAFAKSGGKQVEDVKVYLRYTTSETRKSSLRATIFYTAKIDGKEARFGLGSPIAIAHEGRVCVTKAQKEKIVKSITEDLIRKGSSFNGQNVFDSVRCFEEELPMIGNLFQESEKRIEELGNMDIQNPKFVLTEIRRVYSNIGLTALNETLETIDAEYPSGCTGMDVFMMLYDITNRQAEENSLSPIGYANLCEFTEKLMKLPYDAIDRGERWRKI